MQQNITPRHVSVSRPMQVRFFQDRNLQALEAAINRWLAERSDREIADVCQSVTAEAGGRGGDGEVVISVWYIEG